MTKNKDKFSQFNTKWVSSIWTMWSSGINSVQEVFGLKKAITEVTERKEESK